MSDIHLPQHAVEDSGFLRCVTVSLGERYTMTWCHFPGDLNPQIKMSKHVYDS